MAPVSTSAARVTPLTITAYDLAERYIGTRETAGAATSARIKAMLNLDASWVQDDETPWCSAFVNWIAWHLRLPRSKSLAARSWLSVGRPVTDYHQAARGFDVVILKRGAGDQPGPDVLQAPGHVGFFSAWDQVNLGAISANPGKSVLILGGNQGNAVTLAPFPVDRILGVRRLLE